MLHFLRVAASFWGLTSPFTLYFSLFSANLTSETRFDCDCLRHQAVRVLRRFPGGSRIRRGLAALSRTRPVSETAQVSLGRPFGAFVSDPPKTRFPETKISRARRLVRTYILMRSHGVGRAMFLWRFTTVAYG